MSEPSVPRSSTPATPESWLDPLVRMQFGFRLALALSAVQCVLVLLAWLT